MPHHIVLGATGHVGGAVARHLLAQGERVTAIVHDDARAGDLRDQGAEIATVDLHDSAALARVLQTGDRAFLLNPPAAPSTDTDAEESLTVAAILTALDGTGLDKVVAASTYSAQPGEALGDLSVLYTFEQGLAHQPIPAAINRGAYYFSNWDMALAGARDEGVIRTPFPADFVLPMVAPEDLGRVAAARLLSGVDDVGIRHVEGLARHTPQDVADIVADLLGRPVTIETPPRDGIAAMFVGLGFSAAAAVAYARMTEATLDHPCLPDDPIRGPTMPRDYLAKRLSDHH